MVDLMARALARSDVSAADRRTDRRARCWPAARGGRSWPTPHVAATRRRTCAQGGGAVVCVPSDYVCCSTEKCAQACRGWQACTGKSCSDTSKICGYPGGPYPNPCISKYCSISATASNFCTNYQPQAIRLGWCCRVGEICGSQLNDCTCPGVQCGETLCCARGEVCESNFFGSQECLREEVRRRERRPARGPAARAT